MNISRLVVLMILPLLYVSCSSNNIFWSKAPVVSEVTSSAGAEELERVVWMPRGEERQVNRNQEAAEGSVTFRGKAPAIEVLVLRPEERIHSYRLWYGIHPNQLDSEVTIAVGESDVIRRPGQRDMYRLVFVPVVPVPFFMSLQAVGVDSVSPVSEIVPVP